jgi:cell division protein FtsW
MMQPDMGSTLILLAIATSMYFVAGGEVKPFIGVAGLGVAVMLLAILLSPYRRDRVMTFLNPESDPLGASFHIHQITLALGNGGWVGSGIGNSRQKYSYIPEASTDSIFSIVAEEVGFVGSLLLIALFLSFFLVGYRILSQSKADPFAKLMGVGVYTWLVMQTILNLSAVVALVPLTGVPLPYFSYGGSSLIMLLLATGLLLHLAQET